MFVIYFTISLLQNWFDLSIDFVNFLTIFQNSTYINYLHNLKEYDKSDDEDVDSDVFIVCDVYA